MDAPPAAKKCKTGAAAYGTKYKPVWRKNFPFVSRGHKDTVYSFYCSVCERDVSCSHQGVADIKRHEKCESHHNMVSMVASNSTLSSMGVVPIGSNVSIQVNNYDKISS